jgi:hypothetical protein
MPPCILTIGRGTNCGITTTVADAILAQLANHNIRAIHKTSKSPQGDWHTYDTGRMIESSFSQPR